MFERLHDSGSLIASCDHADGPRPRKLVVVAVKNRAAWYREKASECAQTAESINDASIKAMYVKVAERWSELARQTDAFLIPGQQVVSNP